MGAPILRNNRWFRAPNYWLDRLHSEPTGLSDGHVSAWNKTEGRVAALLRSTPAGTASYPPMRPALRAILAQTDDGTTVTTVPGEVAVIEASRPMSDWLIDVFNLDPDGPTAALLSSIVEPVFQIVVTLVIAWIIIRVARRLARGFINRARVRGAEDGYLHRDPGVAGRRNQRLDALGAVLDSILAVMVWFGALVTILAGTFGFNLAPLLAGAGIIGVAIGFGAQDLVRDFVAGMFMLVEDQYAVGDVIDVGDATGEVEKISLRTTRLRDVNGTVWHFPNGEIRRVGNLSQEWSRALLDIGVAYSSDIDEAAQTIQTVAEEMAAEPAYRTRFLAPPEVWGVEDMTADAVVIRLVIKTVPGEQWGIGREVRRRIKLAFDESGIEIPFPQRTIWIRDEEEATQTTSVRHRSAPTAARGKGAPEEALEDDDGD